MIDKRVAIGALARNCEENLPSNIERIEELRKQFADSYVVVYENDSTDATLKILRKWERESKNVFIISETLDKRNFKFDQKSKLYPDKSISRISKMVYLRNQLKSLIFQYGDPYYIIILDIDIASFSVQGVAGTITNAPHGWGALLSNGRIELLNGNKCKYMPFQYDHFAFCELDRDENKITPKLFNEIVCWKRAKCLNYAVQSLGFYSCKSAFGGMGIYKANVVKSIDYRLIVPNSLESFNACLCEHIPFHVLIINDGYGVYISRLLETTYFIKSISHNVKDKFLWLFPSIYLWIASFVHLIRRVWILRNEQ